MATATADDKQQTTNTDTRRAILQAARERFLHYGYKKTTIDEIASDAGVGKGTVYLYFCGKEEILLTIAHEVKRNITEQMRAIAGSMCGTEDKLRRMMIAKIITVYDACKMAAHGAELVDELVRPRLMQCGHEEQQVQLQIIADVLRDGVRRGELSVPGGDAERAARNLSLAFASFFPPYVGPCHPGSDCRVGFEQGAMEMMEFLLHGLRRRGSAAA